MGGACTLEDYEIIQLCLYNIDIKNDKIEVDNLEKGKANQYVNTVITKSLSTDNTRLFKIKRESTETISLISKFINKLLEAHENKIDISSKAKNDYNINSIAVNISQKLLEAEKVSQQKISKMKLNIKKGSLIQAVISDKDNEKKFSYILAKVEYVGILDEMDWERHIGVPLEKEILRTCIISYNSLGEIEEIKIFDSNKIIADYWKNGLLEVEPLTNNEDNTQKSFNEINKILVNNIRKKSPADYTVLHNSVIGYYNQNKGFDFNEFMEKVIDNYIPQNKEAFNMKKIKDKLEKLPDKRFDRQFEIVPETIRNKKKKIYNINADIDLTIKDSIKNLKDVIKAEKESNNDLFIKIRVDEKTYKDFDY